VPRRLPHPPDDCGNGRRRCEALNLFRPTDESFAEADLEIAQALAKGVLAEYLGISVDEAFQHLRRRARNGNRKLTDLARDVANRRVDPITFRSQTPPS
jgi:hypothetical protein